MTKESPQVDKAYTEHGNYMAGIWSIWCCDISSEGFLWPHPHSLASDSIHGFCLGLVLLLPAAFHTKSSMFLASLTSRGVHCIS